MSNERSPRDVCSMTIGIRGIAAPFESWGLRGSGGRSSHGRPPRGVNIPCSATAWLRIWSVRYSQPASCTTEESEMSGGVVTRSVLIPAGPEEVWEALVDPVRLEDWFADGVEGGEFVPGGEVVF